MFETTVLPICRSYFFKRFADPEMRAVAMVLAWYFWASAVRRGRDLPALCFAKAAARAVWCGRDLPGCGVSADDVWERFRCWGGGGMEAVADRRPGPQQEAEWREELDAIMARLTADQKKMVRLARKGVTRTEDLARALGKSPGRISQLRREIKTRAEE